MSKVELFPERELWVPEVVYFGWERKNKTSDKCLIRFRKGKKSKKDYVIFVERKKVEDYDILLGLFQVLDFLIARDSTTVFVPHRNGHINKNAVFLVPVPKPLAQVILKVEETWKVHFWKEEEEVFQFFNENEEEKLVWYFYLLWHRLHIEERCYPSVRGRILQKDDSLRFETLGGRDLLGATFSVLCKRYGLLGTERINFFEKPSVLRNDCSFFLTKKSKKYKKEMFLEFEKFCFSIKQAQVTFS